MWTTQNNQFTCQLYDIYVYQIYFKLTHSTKSLIIKMIRAQMEWFFIFGMNENENPKKKNCCTPTNIYKMDLREKKNCLSKPRVAISCQKCKLNKKKHTHKIRKHLCFIAFTRIKKGEGITKITTIKHRITTLLLLFFYFIVEKRDTNAPRTHI